MSLTWSLSIRDNSEGMPLSSVRADVPLRTASVGKVLLLLETARALSAGELRGDETLQREPADWVRDSGLWHTLSVDRLPLVDVATLVGAVSDNLATNVLLRTVTLARVASTAAYLELVETALHDRVRDVRGPADPPTLSTGTAAELSLLMWRVARGEALGEHADRQVRQWLSGNVDQSMVGAAFVERRGLDPIAHHVLVGDGLGWFNKTGTDAGVRADVGAVTVGERTVAWAAIANWSAGPDDSSTVVPAVLQRFKEVGEAVMSLC